MTPTLALQWLGAAVVAAAGVVVVIVLLRLFWVAMSRQWTKYDRLKSRVEALEYVVFGNQDAPSHDIWVLNGVRYRLHDEGLVERFKEVERETSVKYRDSEVKSAAWSHRLGVRVLRAEARLSDLESYRPASIENPEDLR